MKWWRRGDIGRDAVPARLADELNDAHARAEADAVAFADAFAVAFAEVRATRRGQSTAEVADQLDARLAVDGIAIPREMLMSHARDIVEPHWPLRHPIEIVRCIRANRRLRGQESPDDPDLVEGEQPDDPELEALIDLLRGAPGLRGVKFSSSTPDMVEVLLEPWSEASAQWVREVCSPRSVQFVDDMPPWTDEVPGRGS